MAPNVFYEIYDSEEALENFINDPIAKGLTPISIYRIPAKATKVKEGYDVVVWWKAEDFDEEE
jgi:hypothetical protein